METPQQRQLRVALEHRLVKQLETLRDTLTHLSLMLNDLKFEVAVSQCQAVAALVTDCIARCQSHHH